MASLILRVPLGTGGSQLGGANVHLRWRYIFLRKLPLEGLGDAEIFLEKRHFKLWMVQGWGRKKLV